MNEPICGQFSMPFPGALGPCTKAPGHQDDHSDGEDDWENRGKPIALRDILTADEIADQRFSADTVLNESPWMPGPHGRLFAQMPIDEQRTYVTAAVGYATRNWTGLCHALAVQLEYAEGLYPNPKATP